jgi:NO-binding membrane sensor protein with MHYT domain
MYYYLTALSIVIGICFAFGLLYLFMGLRRKDDRAPTHRFSLFALSYAAVVLTAIANYHPTSLLALNGDSSRELLDAVRQARQWRAAATNQTFTETKGA